MSTAAGGFGAGAGTDDFDRCGVSTPAIPAEDPRSTTATSDSMRRGIRTLPRWQARCEGIVAQRRSA